MAPNDSATSTPAPDAKRRPGRLAARYGVPVAVIGVAAATIGLVPALASSGDPELPEVTAQELVEKIAASETDQLSGTVKVSVDLGLPSFGGLDLSSLADNLGGEGKGGSTATPEEKLTSLASGTHTLRVAADGPDRQKLTFVDAGDEYSVIRDGDQLWAYDGSTGEALHSKGEGKGKGDRPADDHVSGMSPKELATQALDAADETTRVTVDGTTTVAGRDAYQLALTPKDSGSTVKAVRIAVDAETGTPLKFTVAPADGGKAIVDAGFSKVDFTRPATGTFAPPKDAKITESDDLAPGKTAPGKDGEHGKAPEDAEAALNSLPGPFADLASADGTEVHGKGWASVAELTFPKGEGLPGQGADSGSGDTGGLSLDSLGKQVKGDFGTGTLFSTRVVNALVTEDGRAFVGAVTPERLVEVAGK
ncbi:outer membrane lipoprotein carrier protein LolA [Streptomyces sp. NPDC058373]|uniref:LolA family protein n=1 Tax=Streptomyces sp. NPDC058373 TaxID=3346465 RepID=UPI00365474FF